MAEIPKYNLRQVEPTMGPTVSVPSPVPSGMTELGAVALHGANMLQDALNKQAEEQDNLRVEEQLNRLRERQLDLTIGKEGYSQLLGRSALERPDKKPLGDEYMGKFGAAVQEGSAALSNDRQRLLYQRRAAFLSTEFRRGVLQHEDRQNKVYGDSVDNGVFKVEVENAARNWYDPEAVGNALTRIDEAIDRKRQRDGISAELMTDVRRDLRSAVHHGVLMQALNAKNFEFVSKYLEKNGFDMNAKDTIGVVNAYRHQDVANFAVTEATQAMREIEKKSAPTEFDNMILAMASQESGNRQFDGNGNVVTSPKGALGRMQVMPSTGPEAAKLAGVPWDENRLRNDPEYNTQLGEAYYREQLKTFGGRAEYALAAYNAGPGATRAAIDAAAKAGKPETWLANLPKETQGYVASIMKKYASGVQAPRPTILDAQRRVEAAAGADTEKRAAAVAEVNRQWQAMESARKQVDEQVMDTTLKELEANGGNFNALPLNLRTKIPGDKLATVHSFAQAAQKRAAGLTAETNPAAYFLLSDEAELRKLTPSQFLAFKQDLSEADFKHFTNEYRKLTGATAVAKQEDLNSGYVKQILDSRLIGLGMDPNPKDKAGTAAQRVGAIRQYIDQELLAAQKAKGDKLTDAEIQQKVDGMVSLDQKFRTRYLFGGASEWESRRLLTTKPGDIPIDIRQSLEADFRRRGITPNDNDILAAYLRLRTIQSRSANAK